MILTTCAACAAPLAHDAPRCVRCKLRYCDATCQHDHWRRGHKQMCKKIHRGGNAEQYNADTKYKEAVAEAVEACADDTKGQTCYICTQALHWKTKEGLVRMCACRGTAGFAHVSCLAEQAKILREEGEENNLGTKAMKARSQRWHTCGLCEQKYHGVVACALGWACWKTYVGRTEEDLARGMAMSVLGYGLICADHPEDALSVREAELSRLRRIGGSEKRILAVQNNIAGCYRKLGRHQESLKVQREIYARTVNLLGAQHEETLTAGRNLAIIYAQLGQYEESKSVFRAMIPLAKGVELLQINYHYGLALIASPSVPVDDVREAVATLTTTEAALRRVLGANHPEAQGCQRTLDFAKRKLAARLAARVHAPNSETA